MKKRVFSVLFIILFAGCGLIPKRLEFFQSKVPSVPDKKESTKESEKQAAVYVSQKIDEATKSAIEERASTNITNPLNSASPVARALSVSLGPPLVEFMGNPDKLAKALTHDTAIFDNKIEQYKQKIEPLEGKKIEHTGLFSVGYFTYVGIVIGLAFLIWTGIKIFGAFYPPVGIGASVIGRVSSKLVSSGFSQVVHGVEALKDHLKTSDTQTYSTDQILELIKSFQERKQSPEVQEVVKKLTN